MEEVAIEDVNHVEGNIPDKGDVPFEGDDPFERHVPFEGYVPVEDVSFQNALDEDKSLPQLLEELKRKVRSSPEYLI
jgi:hypothetical protein